MKDKDEDLLPFISFDYGYFGLPGEIQEKVIGSSKLPIMIIKDRHSKTIFSHPVPAKGIEDPYAAQQLLRDLDMMGYRRIVLKCDQEDPIKAVADHVKSKWSGEVVPENSPKGESKSNGEIERAVQEVQGMARTLKDALEAKAGVELVPRMAILAWLVEYCGTLVTLFLVGADGLTAYHRLRGRPWKIQLPPFGECVEYLRRTRHKLQARWDKGLFLGVKITTSEKIIGTPNGVYVVQSIRRKPEGQRRRR